MTQQVPYSMLDATVAAAIAAAVAAASAQSGDLKPTAVAAAPTGWLLCDGSAVSRTTYAALFAAIGATYGAGDGSTTFNVPDGRGRALVGAGTGASVETVTSQAASGNAVPVASNTAKWNTGMQVTVSGASGFTGLTNGTWFIVRASSTTVQFATSLANAQNGIVATITGTGSCVITWSGTARARGEVGGEEGHAMSSTELLAHSHSVVTITAGAIAQAGSSANVAAQNAGNTGSTGGNAAMNVMQPYFVGNWLIKT